VAVRHPLLADVVKRRGLLGADQDGEPRRRQRHVGERSSRVQLQLRTRLRGFAVPLAGILDELPFGRDQCARRPLDLWRMLIDRITEYELRRRSAGGYFERPDRMAQQVNRAELLATRLVVIERLAPFRASVVVDGDSAIEFLEKNRGLVMDKRARAKQRIAKVVEFIPNLFDGDKARRTQLAVFIFGVNPYHFHITYAHRLPDAGERDNLGDSLTHLGLVDGAVVGAASAPSRAPRWRG